DPDCDRERRRLATAIPGSARRPAFRPQPQGAAAVGPPDDVGSRRPASIVGMKIGIGLPTTIPGTPGRLLVDWARRAEELGFSSLATIDRIVYPCYEPLTVLAAAGAATQRIGLFTNIL